MSINDTRQRRSQELQDKADRMETRADALVAASALLAATTPPMQDYRSVWQSLVRDLNSQAATVRSTAASIRSRVTDIQQAVEARERYVEPPTVEEPTPDPNEGTWFEGGQP